MEKTLLILLSIASSSTARYLIDDCPSDFSIHILLPHETDCNRFYQCSNGQKIPMTCPSGLHFDFNIQACNFPSEVSCGNISQLTTTPGTVETTTVKLPTEGSLTTSSEFLPNGCPVDIHVHYLLPHEYDCTKFYQCEFGERHLKFCPSGLYFDIQIQTCNWPRFVSCEIQKNETTQPTFETTTTVSTKLDDGTTANDATASVSTEEPSLTTDPQVASTKDVISTNFTTLSTDSYYSSTNSQTDFSTTDYTTVTDDLTTSTTKTYPSSTETNEISTENPTTATASTNFGTEQLSTLDPSTQYTTLNVENTKDLETIFTSDSSTVTDVSTDKYTADNTELTTEATTLTATSTTSVDNEIIVTSTDVFATATAPSETISFTTENETIHPESSTATIDLTTQDSQNSITDEPNTVTETLITTITNEGYTTINTDQTEITPIITDKPNNIYTTLITNTEHDTTTLQYNSSLDTSTTESQTQSTLSESTTSEYFNTKETIEETETLVTDKTTIESSTTTQTATDNSPVTEISTESSGSTNEVSEASTTDHDLTTQEITDVTLTTNNPSDILPTLWTTEREHEPTATQTESTSLDTSKEPESSFKPTETESTESSTSVESTTQEYLTTTENMIASTIDQVSTTQAPICTPGTIGNVAHPEICDSYYFCSGSVPILLRCPTGQEFDREVKRCVPIHEGGCTLGPTTQMYTTEDVYTTNEPTTKLATIEGSPENVSTTNDLTMTTDTETAITDQTTIESSTTSQAATDSSNVTETTTKNSDSSELTTTNEVTETMTTQQDVTTREITDIVLTTNNPSDIFSTSWTTEKEYETTTTQNESSSLGTSSTDYESTDSSTKPTEAESTDSSTTGESTTVEYLITTENMVATTIEEVSTTQAPICTPGTIGNVAHPEFCDSYYFCSGSVPILLRCPTGQEFDREIKRCVPIHEGGCTLGPTTQMYTTEDVYTTNEPTTKLATEEVSPENISTTMTTDRETSITYQTTIESSTTAESATDSSTVTESSTKNIDSTESLSTNEVTEAATTQQDVTDIIHTTNNPSNIFSTSWTTEKEYETTATQNDSSSVNTSSTDSESSSKPTEPESINSSTTEESTTREYLTTTENVVTTTIEQVSTTQAPICTPGTIGNVAHPELCNSYYFCSGSVPILLRCPIGQEFDREVKRCVDIHEGGCTLGPTTQIYTTEDVYTTNEPTVLTTNDLTTSTDRKTAITDQTTFESSTTPQAATDSSTVTEFSTKNSDSTEPLTTNEVTEAATTQQDVTKQENTDVTLATTNPLDILSTSWTTLKEYETIATQTDSSFLDTSSKEPESSSKPSEPESTDSSTTGESTTQEYLATTENTIATTAEQVSTTQAPICTPGTIGNVAHPELCDSYYFCSGSIPILLRCPAGQEFDREVKRCVAIREGGCTLGSTTQVYTTVGIDITNSSTTTQVAISTTASSLPIIITEAPSTGTLPTTVSTMTTRLSTKEDIEAATIQEQITTQETTDVIHTTNNPLDILSTAGTTQKEYEITTTQDNSSSSDTSSTKTEANSTVRPTTVKSTTWDYLTTTENVATSTIKPMMTTQAPLCLPGTIGNVAHPELCDSYYFCSGSVPILLRCPTGQEFDPDVKRCGPVREGGCTLTSRTQWFTTEEAIAPKSILSEVLTLLGFVKTEQTISPESREIASSGQDISTKASLCLPNVIGSVPHPDLCTSYYFCSGSRSILLNCPEGQEFDPRTSRCAEIQEGGCTLAFGYFENKIENTRQKNTDDVSSHMMTFNPEEANQVCPIGYNGFVSHPKLCNSFYLCTDINSSLQLFCPQGYEFNQKSSRCQLDETGACGKTQNL